MLIIYVIVACKHFLISPRLLLYLGRSALLWARSPAGFVEDALGDPLVALVVWKNSSLVGLFENGALPPNGSFDN